MLSLLFVIDLVLELYTWVIIATVISSWLIAFNIINRYNKFVMRILDFLDRLTMPFYNLIRRVLQPIGGGIVGSIDLAPLVALLCIFFARNLLREAFYW